jgi:hypothetical protein
MHLLLHKDIKIVVVVQYRRFDPRVKEKEEESVEENSILGHYQRPRERSILGHK